MNTDKNIEIIVDGATKIRRAVNRGSSEDVNMLELMSQKQIDSLVERLEDSERADMMSIMLERSNPDLAASRLREAIGNMPRKSAKRVRRALYIAISSVAAAVLFISFLLYTGGSDDKVLTANDTATPATNVSITRPTLITTNGDFIELGGSVEIDRLLALEDSSIKKRVENEQNQLIVPFGCTQTTVLSDGTEVTLNAGSTLSFPTTFDNNSRKVSLKGEAYFKVSKSEVPFVVSSGDVDVKVYGTEFNINARHEGRVESLLVEGSVGVTCGDNSEVMIVPREMLTYNTESGNYECREVEVRDYLAWRDNEFLYQRRCLKFILEDIASWYGVEFDVKVGIDYDITCRLSRDSDVDDILKVLEKATEVKFIKTRKGMYEVNVF